MELESTSGEAHNETARDQSLNHQKPSSKTNTRLEAKPPPVFITGVTDITKLEKFLPL